MPGPSRLPRATENDGFLSLHFLLQLATIVFDKRKKGQGSRLRIVKRYVRYRTFSQLGRLQSAHRIRYSLVLGPGRTAAYEAEREAEGEGCAACGGLTGLGGREARWILEYLYENAVPPEHLRDVLDDLQKQVGGTNGKV